MLSEKYLEKRNLNFLPRLPFEGRLDLTYRCNNNCRHCWLRIPANASEKKEELTFDQIKKIADDARKLGCRKWAISGGEPMIREDFCEIFNYLTKISDTYSINTNGTLITPKIAQLLKRPGKKMVALYGATAEVHDYITCNPGSFEKTLEGMKYLKEAGASFMVQILILKDNYHQLNKMIKLAESLSSNWRFGSAWLYLSASGDKERNKEIIRQRLAPQDVIKLEPPDVCYEEQIQEIFDCQKFNKVKEKYFFASCIKNKKSFHIDPYGNLSFCAFLKDLNWRYNLKKGSFKNGWEDFIPSLAKKMKVTKRYLKNCGSCQLRSHCRFCNVYSYLEHRSFDKPVRYLCQIAQEHKKFKKNWLKNHRRYFKIADITIQVDSDLPFTSETFHPKFKLFEVPKPGKEIIKIRHHFFIPDLNKKELGLEVYRKSPWAIYKKGESWIYLGIPSDKTDKNLRQVMVFNSDYSLAKIYNPKKTNLNAKENSVAFTITDQIFLAPFLSFKKGLILHACGVIMNGKGLLFVGHSGAGKSTIARLLKNKAKILCDDRVIIRDTQKGLKIYGTWNHGIIPDVSPLSTQLSAIFFLKKSKKENKITTITKKNLIIQKLLPCIIRPLATKNWWEKTLTLVTKIYKLTPFFILEFKQNQKVADVIKQFLKNSLPD